MWDSKKYQGKRKDQVEFSEMMVGISIMGIILLLGIRFIYYVISLLIH